MQRTFTIGTVARLVGVTTHVLRVWERRYDLKLSSRNEKGRRVYSSGEIEKLKLIKHALDQGFKISDIADMSVNELTHLSQKDTADSNPEAITTGKTFLVYGERLAHWLFRARVNTPYRVVTNLPSLINEVEASDVLPKALMLELEEITEEIEELLYSTKLQLPDDVKVYVFNRTVETEVRDRVKRAGIVFVDDDINSELLRSIVDKFSSSVATPNSTQKAELTSAQVNALLHSKSAIYCECPKHMGDLYLKIDEFIRYTDDCERLSPKDSAVHQHIAKHLKSMRKTLTKMTLDVAQMDEIDLGE